MMAAVCTALASVSVAHVIYVNSDTVYADANARLSATSYAHLVSIHDVMHLVREVMPADVYKSSMCILRPTCIYGAADPYDGYNPHLFRRLANRREEIIIFGEGEKLRDYVYIDGVAEVVALCVAHKSYGILNIAPGTVTSFSGIAEKIAGVVPEDAIIRFLPRSGPTLHRDYRALNASSTAQAFPDFHYSPLGDGLRLSQKREFSNG